MKHWYQELFENYAKKYDQESFTQGTLQEVDFFSVSSCTWMELNWGSKASSVRCHQV